MTAGLRVPAYRLSQSSQPSTSRGHGTSHIAQSLEAFIIDGVYCAPLDELHPAQRLCLCNGPVVLRCQVVAPVPFPVTTLWVVTSSTSQQHHNYPAASNHLTTMPWPPQADRNKGNTGLFPWHTKVLLFCLRPPTFPLLNHTLFSPQQTSQHTPSVPSLLSLFLHLTFTDTHKHYQQTAAGMKLSILTVGFAAAMAIMGTFLLPPSLTMHCNIGLELHAHHSI